MRLQPTPDVDGWEEVNEKLPVRDTNDKYPRSHTEVSIVVKEGSSNQEYKGVLLEIRPHLTQDKEKREEHQYDGFFMKVRRNGEGHLNVYGDPDTGGPCIIRVPDWDNKGSRPYKMPIQSISLRVDESKRPECPRCDTLMTFGYSEENENRVPAADGSYGEWECGWLCPGCFPGLIRECVQLP